MRGRVVVLGLLGTAVLAATPAAAYHSPWDMREQARRGNTIAIVTRTDHGKPPHATFRVDAAYGADVPATLAGEVDSGMGCQPAVFPDEVAAVLFERRAQGWVQAECAEADFVEALTLVYGEPVARPGGPVVAVAMGEYGSSTLAGLDAGGTVVAWDRRGGFARRVTVCPGGRTVVVTGSRRGATVADREELWVHDAATLRLKRAVLLPMTSVAGLRCTDEDGDVVQLLGTEDGRHLLTVDGRRVDSVEVPTGVLGEVAEIASGFLALADHTELDDGPATLVRIDADGAATNLPTPPGLHDGDQLDVAPDGVTVAVVGSGSIATVDARTGSELGRWKLPASTAGTAWTAAGRLLVRVGYETGWGEPRQGTLVTLDRRLREVNRRPATSGRNVAAIGETAVTFGRTRVTATPKGGESRVLAELRLVETWDLVALSDADFEPAPETAQATVSEPGVVRAVRWTPRPTTDGPARAVLACLAAAALVGAGSRVRRRQ